MSCPGLSMYSADALASKSTRERRDRHGPHTGYGDRRLSCQTHAHTQQQQSHFMNSLISPTAYHSPSVCQSNSANLPTPKSTKNPVAPTKSPQMPTTPKEQHFVSVLRLLQLPPMSPNLSITSYLHLTSLSIPRFHGSGDLASVLSAG